MSLTIHKVPTVSSLPKAFSPTQASLFGRGQTVENLMAGDSVDAHPIIDGNEEQDYALLNALRDFLADANPLQRALILKNPKLVLTYLQAYHRGMLDKLAAQPAANDLEPVRDNRFDRVA